MTSLAQHARRGFVWPYPSQGLESFSYGSAQYFGVASSNGSTQDTEPPPAGFAQMVDGPWRSNATVFACEQKRISIFSEARFLYRAFNKGRPGRLWSDPTLDILEVPWPRGKTSDLMAETLVMADLGGNGYVARQADGGPDRLRVLRPDWITIVMGDSSGRRVESPSQLDCEILGFIYNPQDSRIEPETLLADEVAHFIPPGLRDPLSRFRGMSWLTPVIREVQADQAATMHKLMFFEQGATPQLVVKFDASVTKDQFKDFVIKMDESHNGWRKAYKTLYLGAGADVTPVGKDLQQLEFSETQGKGETRIIAASGLHPVLLPSSEGMQGSSLNAGNYGAARRSVADTTFRPLWRNMAGSLETVVPAPSGSELWYDEQGIAFLREDAEDAAKIEQIKAETINGLVREGFTWRSAVAAVTAQDMTLLEHTGFVSVQLQQLGAAEQKNEPAGLPAPKPPLAIAGGS